MMSFIIQAWCDLWRDLVKDGNLIEKTCRKAILSKTIYI